MPEPGDFLVTTTKNDDIRARLYAAGIRWITTSEFNHAAIYLGNDEFLHSVHPAGVEVTPYRKTWKKSVWSSGKFDLSAEQRSLIVAEGRALVGTSYAPRRTILAYALSQDTMHCIIDRTVDLDSQPHWVRKLVSPGFMVCSQLVAYLYKKAGAYLPNIDALGLVSPADLHRALVM